MATEHLVIPMRRYLPWIWTGVVFAITLVLLVSNDVDSGDLLFIALPTVYTALGAVIVSHSPGNRIGWLFFAVGAGSLLEPIASPYLESNAGESSVLVVLAYAAVATSFFVFFLIPVPLLQFIFPTGRFLTRRWSWAGWLACLMIVDILFVVLFAEEIHSDHGTIVNPIGFHALGFENESSPTIAFFGFGLFALLIGGVVAIVERYRRSDAVTRAQIKWFAYTAPFWAAGWIYRVVKDDRGLVTDLVTGAANLLLVVAIVVAITRYRLFDIDRLVSRTVGYAIVVGVLAVTFAGLIALPGLLLGPAEDSPLAIAASTLAVAALFNPVRKRVVGWIDRRFNRSRYDAERVVAGFGDRLQDEVDLDRVANDSIDVVVDTMQPETIGIWVKE